MTGILILIALVVLAVALGAVMIVLSRRRKLPPSAARQVESLLTRAMAQSDARIRILELDNALDALLTHLGYKGTLGEKLKKAGARFRNTNALWAGHKLRNMVAHESNVAVSDKDVERMRDAVQAALRHVSPRSY